MYCRFACRILCSREGPDYAARIFAAGFDSSRNIFLGEKATKWETEHQVGIILNVLYTGILKYYRYVIHNLNTSDTFSKNPSVCNQWDVVAHWLWDVVGYRYWLSDVVAHQTSGAEDRGSSPASPTMILGAENKIWEGLRGRTTLHC